MAYHIDYDQIPLPQKGSPSLNPKLLLLGAAVLAVAVCLVSVFGARMAVQQMFFPGSNAATAAALEELATSVVQGENVGEAVYAFCQNVLETPN